ncbi:amidohydrolase [Flavobacteriaceae bacterium]|jgi:amidohydrolase|nr:amidohydrolase [Cryomorphaceae bacterium]MDA9595752.1 amidohydrolase [Flavobacteriaceae bacterium]MBT4236981.1 amidohydrolase [Cryomorphaceae bacterium]MBT5416438.1 amidohydrolase [Cryomorphaceae bacterium]MBT6224402.1 amidohydrolase [Cryomorphaceae bacterium]
MKNLSFIFFILITQFSYSQTIETQITDIEEKLISWRHEFHKYPEVSNREFKTSEVIAKHLESLGISVTRNVGVNGVVGILEGKNKGKVVALRADMDALPITENNNLPFQSVNDGVMHACGHDSHMSILMATAEILSKNRNFNGTVKFIFQGAEEGPPPGEEGGARMMIKEGVLKNPDVDAIFGLHISSMLPMNKVYYKPRGFFASSSRFTVKVIGSQSHGGTPWLGVDPIVITSQIINSFQTIISRESNLTNEPAVISFGIIEGGNRFNIIPNEVNLVGTIRSLDYDMRDHIKKRMKELAEGIAESYGGNAIIEIVDGADITYNNPELMEKMLPSLKNTAGNNNVILNKAKTLAEDYAYYLNEIPGFIFELGGYNTNETRKAPPHHTPDFFIDDSSMLLGVKVMTNLALDFLDSE